MTDVVILGAGVMGSAMAMPAAAAGASVALVGTPLDGAIVSALEAGDAHPRLGVRMPAGVTTHRPDAAAALLDRDPDLVVLGVSSAGVDWAIDRLCEGLRKPVSVLMITKGLVPSAMGGIEVLPVRVARELGRRRGLDAPVMAIGGPCIAGELAASRDTSVVITGPSDTVARTLGLLSAPFYHARSATDLVGVEICAAFKNFFALAVGAVAGIAEKDGKAANGAAMHNLSSSVFTQSISEMALLVEASGGDPRTASGLAGAGDLYVTCQAGRNSRMGRLLGLGLPYTRAKLEHMPDDTVEGAQLALDLGPTLVAMFERGKLDTARMPLTSAIVDAVCRDRPLRLDFKHFHRM